MEIKAKIKAKKDGTPEQSGSAGVNVGDNLAGAVEIAGEAVVYSIYKAQAVIAAQAQIRRYLTANLSDVDIADKMAAWKPGIVTRSRKDPVTKATEIFNDLDPAGQKALIARLKEQMKGK